MRRSFYELPKYSRLECVHRKYNRNKNDVNVQIFISRGLTPHEFNAFEELQDIQIDLVPAVPLHHVLPFLDYKCIYKNEKLCE